MSKSSSNAPASVSDALLLRIRDAIRSVRFGTIQITIHNAHVVQIEKHERIRLDEMADPAAGSRIQATTLTDQISGAMREGEGGVDV